MTTSACHIRVQLLPWDPDQTEVELRQRLLWSANSRRSDLSKLLVCVFGSKADLNCRKEDILTGIEWYAHRNMLIKRKNSRTFLNKKKIIRRPQQAPQNIAQILQIGRKILERKVRKVFQALLGTCKHFCSCVSVHECFFFFLLMDHATMRSPFMTKKMLPFSKLLQPVERNDFSNRQGGDLRNEWGKIKTAGYSQQETKKMCNLWFTCEFCAC